MFIYRCEPPLLACHIAQAGSHQHQGGVTIRKAAHNSGSAAYFTVQTLKRIVRPNVPLVGHGKIIIRKNGSRWYSRLWLQARIRFELHRPKSVSAIFHPQKHTVTLAQVADYTMLQTAQKSSDSGADPATQKSLGNVTDLPPEKYAIEKLVFLT